MDHVVYVDTKDGELVKLLNRTKKMIIRGATGRKMPHGRVNAGDRLFFIQNNGEGLVRASAPVISVLNSDRLSEVESAQLVEQHQAELQLGQALQQRWSGKRYLVLVQIGDVTVEEPFAIDRSEYGNMDDWLPVGKIERVRKVQAS